MSIAAEPVEAEPVATTLQGEPVREPRGAALSRYAQALAFVGLWVALGAGLKLDTNVYLVLGVPLTFAFQLLVRRRPVRDLWVRDGAPLQISSRLVLLALAFAIVPAFSLVQTATLRAWPGVLWNLAALGGAVAAAYALCQLDKSSARLLVICLLTVGMVGCGMFVAAALARSLIEHRPAHPSLRIFATSLLSYLPGVFFLEEVSFRGLLDAHVHPDPKRRGLLSALFVSVLWGLWHWPVVPHDGPASWWQTLLSLVAVHSLLGVPLSLFWRKSGNLAVPAFTHAFIDAVRNGVLAGG